MKAPSDAVMCPVCHGQRTRIKDGEERLCFLCEGAGTITAKMAATIRSWQKRKRK